MWRGNITNEDRQWIDDHIKVEPSEEVNKMSFEIVIPKGDFTPIEDGVYKAVVTDVENVGMGKYGKTQFKFKFELADSHIKVTSWTSNSWWWKDPNPSKLFKLCQAAGIVKTESKYPSLPEDIVGKELKLKIVNTEEGFPRVKDYLSV